MSTSQWTWALVALTFTTLLVFLPKILSEVFPWQKLWAQRNGRPTLLTPSYSGRTALVTGANGAFGSRAAKIFASRGIETLVLVDVRDCSALKKEIEAEWEKVEVKVWQIDFMSFKGCRELAMKASKELKTIDHVLMTMGILSFSRRESPEVWETSIQVNYLSNACSALLLLPLLKSSPANPNPPVLTFITSFGIFPAAPTMWSLSKNGSYLRQLSNNKDGMAQAHQYGRSKGLLLYFARELAARVRSKFDVTINSADPGTAWTGLTAPNRSNPIAKLITDFGARDPEVCATALVNGVSAGRSGHGKIMVDFGTDEYPPFMDRRSGLEAQQRVWEETRDELVLKVPEIQQIFTALE